MTHPVHFRKKVLSYLADGHTMRQAASKYDLSTSTIQGWKSNLEPKTTRQSKSRTIDDDALRQDVELYPDGYHRERAYRLNCSTRGIGTALKRLGITQKKDTKPPKSQ